jgi:hypothetical protein
MNRHDGVPLFPMGEQHLLYHLENMEVLFWGDDPPYLSNPDTRELYRVGMVNPL